MSDQILWDTDLLRPLVRSAAACGIASSVMHLDGTSIPARDKETGHRVLRGALWCYTGDGLAVYWAELRAFLEIQGWSAPMTSGST